MCCSYSSYSYSASIICKPTKEIVIVMHVEDCVSVKNRWLLLYDTADFVLPNVNHYSLMPALSHEQNMTDWVS